MAEAIFQTGTTTKGNLIQTIKNLMVSAGWQDISSNAATDFIVMYSRGESGDKDLVFQMRENNASASQNITSTDYGTASVRFVATYTPGTPGSAGTFGRAAIAWQNMNLGGETTALFPPATAVTYRYHVNKNRLIILIEYANASPSGYIHIGIPDIQYCSEPLSRGLTLACFGAGNGSVVVSDVSGEQAQTAATVTRTVYMQTQPKQPNIAGRYHPAEIIIGDATEGWRFQLSGLYTLLTTSLVHNDQFVIGAKKYQVFISSGTAVNSINAKAIVYRIE